MSPDDVPQLLSLGWVYQLPFGAGKPVAGNTHGVLGKLISNWQLSATQTYQQGRPLGIVMTNDLGGLLFDTVKHPNKVAPGINTGFTDPATQSYLQASGWSNPGPLKFGNAPNFDPHTRGFGYFNEDFSLFKDTYFGEHRFVRFGADGGNIFNRVDFCAPDNNFTDAGFGQTHSQCNIPRRIQIELQVFF